MATKLSLMQRSTKLKLTKIEQKNTQLHEELERASSLWSAARNGSKTKLSDCLELLCSALSASVDCTHYAEDIRRIGDFLALAEKDPMTEARDYRFWCEKAVEAMTLNCKRFTYGLLFSSLMIDWVEHGDADSQNECGSENSADASSSSSSLSSSMSADEVASQLGVFDDKDVEADEVAVSKFAKFLERLYTPLEVASLDAASSSSSPATWGSSPATWTSSTDKRKKDAAAAKDGSDDDVDHDFDDHNTLPKREARSDRAATVAVNSAMLRSHQRLSALFTYGEFAAVSEDDVRKALPMVGELVDQRTLVELAELDGDVTSLREIASAFSVMLADIESWRWSAPVELFERADPASGKKRLFQHGDVFETLFLAVVGLKLCRLLPSCVDFGKVWRFGGKFAANGGMDYTNGHEPVGTTLAGSRAAFASSYVLSMLSANSLAATSLRGAGRRAAPAYNEANAVSGVGCGVQAILERACAEAMIARMADPEHGDELTVVGGDFKSFGPSLSHAVLLAMLKFYSVPDRWHTFFEHFLAVPVRRADGSVSTINRGTPVAHLVSRFLNELLLVHLDLYVLREQRAPLYRIHDDVFYWSNETAHAERVWALVLDFAECASLRINNDKSGSIVMRSARADKALAAAAATYPHMAPLSYDPDCAWLDADLARFAKDVDDGIWVGAADDGAGAGGDNDSDDDAKRAPLPVGSLGWSFYRLTECGTIEIDYALLRADIERMKEELDHVAQHGSIIAWVKCFNKAMRRIEKSSGRFAKVFGIEHIEEVRSALCFAIKMLTGTDCGDDDDPIGSITGALDRLIRSRIDCHVDSILSSWMMMPLTAGGAGLRNPFMLLHAKERAWTQSCALTSALSTAKMYSEGVYLFMHSKLAAISKRAAARFTRAAYRSRLAHSRTWGQALNLLAEFATDAQPSPSSAMTRDMTDFSGSQLSNSSVDIYYHWLVWRYVPLIRQEFASVRFIDRTLVPLGLIATLNKGDLK
jgi:hypothetical protein